MKIGLIGTPGSGKTTVFNVLTDQDVQIADYGSRGKSELHLGVIKVPDPRIDRLAEIFNPRKTTYAETRFTDFPATRCNGNRPSPNGLVVQMREVEAMALVLNDFAAEADPLKELKDLLVEMILSDLAVVENRLERLRKEKGKDREPEILEQCRVSLENEESLRNLSFRPDEERVISGFGFLSRKPLLALFNTAEERAGQELTESYRQELERRGIAGMRLSGKLELEIARLEKSNRESFLRELGIQEPARDRFIRASYSLLDLVSFFTTGEDEVRAWTIKRGTPARAAAGKIHSDIERGFIRAEVVDYDDFMRLGSEGKCREAGKLRLEGKDYAVRDGDIVHFRFNV